MIDFKCPHCELDVRVPAGSAGLRGRCPKCKSLITVPDKSRPRPGPAGLKPAPHLPAPKKPRVSQNRKIRDLYHFLLKSSPITIVKHKVTIRDEIVLEVVTGPERKRSQAVSAFTFHDSSSGDWICIASPVGSVSEQKTAMIILRAAYYFTGARVYMDHDQMVYVLAERKLARCGRKEFIELVCSVARYADRLERSIFEWDMV